MSSVLKIFRKKEEKPKRNLLVILKKMILFSTLNKRELKKLALIAYEKKYNADEYLFKENNPASCLFIIKEGEVLIERTNEEEDILQLATLKTGDFFGELTLLEDTTRTASARCIKNTEVIAFFKEDLLSLIEREPVMGIKILFELAKMIGQRLKETNKLVHKYKTLTLKYEKLYGRIDAQERRE